MIIDFHTHTFPDAIASRVVKQLGGASHTLPFSDGSMDGLISSMKKSGVDYSVTLPVMTNTGQVEKINNLVIQQQELAADRGIIAFGGMHPDYENYKQELIRLREHRVPGIKLHPAYQNVDLNDIRMMRIIDAASEQGLIILTHAGIDIGIFDHNYASVSHILQVVDELRPEKLVLAHMGNWGCWEDTLRRLAGAPVWFDTAFSIGPITADPAQETGPYLETNLSDEAFVRLCRAHGTDRILFGTDSPWADQKDYVERVQHMPLTEDEKQQIFSENAKKLLTPFLETAERFPDR